jgi:hypothetical protein
MVMVEYWSGGSDMPSSSEPALSTFFSLESDPDARRVASARGTRTCLKSSRSFFLNGLTNGFQTMIAVLLSSQLTVALGRIEMVCGWDFLSDFYLVFAAEGHSVSFTYTKGENRQSMRSGLVNRPCVWARSTMSGWDRDSARELLLAMGGLGRSRRIYFRPGVDRLRETAGEIPLSKGLGPDDGIDARADNHFTGFHITQELIEKQRLKEEKWDIR